MAKRRKRRHALSYRVFHTEQGDGHGRRWWADEHVQEEVMLIIAHNRDEAWYLLRLHHDNWEKHPPRIELISTVPAKA